ncbi:MAG: PEP-CTERM sorting domain-containing protein [Planctomycetota bacterium]
MPHTAFALSLAIICGPASALVVGGGNGTTTPTLNTQAPSTNPYWDNVGWGNFGTSASSPGSAIYIGNGLVLTADHTSGNRIILGTDDPSGGTTFSAAPGGINQNLTNPDSSTSELRIFEVSGDPGLAAVPIYDQPLTAGTALMMIGTGITRGSAEQGYDFTGSPAVDAFGYDQSGTRDKTWGTNAVTSVGTFYNDISGLNNFWGFTAEFNDLDGEAMAADKDSGSAVFAFDTVDNRWELAGIATAITGFQDQPSGTSLYGTSTIFIDLTPYSAQINALIPEPTSLALLATGGLLVMTRRKQH